MVPYNHVGKNTHIRKINKTKQNEKTRCQTQGLALTGTQSLSAKETYELYLQQVSRNWHLKWGSVEAVAGTAVTRKGKVKVRKHIQSLLQSTVRHGRDA